MSKILVMNTKYHEVTSESDDDNEWAQDSYSIDNNIQGIQKSEKYFDLDVPFEVNKNELYFLVVGYYSTGNSFHQVTGEIEYVDLYKTEDLAYKCQETLEEHYNKKDNDSESYTCTLIRENGTKYQFYVPWIGCFERLEHIDVLMVKVIDEDEEN